MSEVKITNAFTLRKRTKVAKKNWDKYYVNLVPHDYVVKTGEGDEDYTIQTRYVEDKVDINKLIQSQSSEVGIYNLLDKVARTGDETLLPKPFDDKSGQIIDATKFPSDLMEAYAQQDRAVRAFDALPDELKKGRKFNDFAKDVTDEEAIAFVKSFISSQLPHKEEKKGD